jgi:hypothetical protein
MRVSIIIDGADAKRTRVGSKDMWIPREEGCLGE